MKSTNLETLKQSFDIQANKFDSNRFQFSNQEYLEYILDNIAPSKDDKVLEVASGTCICGRFLSYNVKDVVCLDATISMLQKGRDEAYKEDIDNISFVKGYAEELPFLDNSFDIVFSRLAFHHITDIERVFSEMVRVLKPNGKLVMIDMEATQEQFRNMQDRIETMRDPSHNKNLSKDEMKELYQKFGLTIQKCNNTEIEQNLNNWLDLTDTPENIKEDIYKLMQEDIDGLQKTGFNPYISDNDIYFKQNWTFILGEKSS